MAPVRYFIETQTFCEKCDGKGSTVLSEVTRAYCFPCEGRGYVLGKQEVEPAVHGSETVYVKVSGE